MLAIIALSTSVLALGDINVDVRNGFAIDGYDPVAYFVSAEPQKGNPKFAYEHQGNQWLFANQANKQAFIADPDAYIPQYGGYCAYAASRGYIADIDPYAWTIFNKKLYLNYNIPTRSIWLRARDNNIIRADNNWPELSKQVKE